MTIIIFCAQCILLILIADFVKTLDNDSIQIKTLTESVKNMISEGFSNKEIINSIKLELDIDKTQNLLGKLSKGIDLNLKEKILSEIKSTNINDNDGHLIKILKASGINLLKEQNSTNVKPEAIISTYESLHTEPISKASEKLESIFSEDFGEFETLKENDRIGERLYKPDYAYSPYDLMKLVKVERSIYQTITKYVDQVETKMQLLKSYLKDYQESSLRIAMSDPNSNIVKNAETIVSNPLSSLKLIRRFAYKLPKVWGSVAQDLDLEEELWRNLVNVQTLLKDQPPNEQDWKDSIEGLLRIQQYNDFKADEIANGNLGSIKSLVRLSAEECMEIGIRAKAINQFDLALEWLYLAMKKVSETANESEIKLKSMLEQLLQSTISEHNKAWDNQSTQSHVFEKKLVNPKYVEIATKQSTLLRQHSKQYRQISEYGFHVQQNFMSLCAGENLQSDEEKARLFCRLERTKHPYFYISPIKMEILSEDPFLVQIYDLVSENLMNDLKNTSILFLERSQVINYDDPETNDVSLVRTSSQTWVDPHTLNHSSDFDKLTKLIEKVTGLSTRAPRSSEEFQIACYGTSHHYDEHLDAIQDARRTAETGERIATFMFYLSDVEGGGYTAFPVVGTYAKPIKGSAVFWYNLKKNGENDQRTWHGGCPVVNGIKWVMNNWILEHANFQHRRCSLDPDE